MIKQIVFILIAYFVFSISLKGQSKDTIEVSPKPKPAMADTKKAMLYSLIPGGGQVYNKKYWKVPIIYVGFGVLTYSVIFYNGVYSDVRTAYRQKINKEPVTNLEYTNVSEDMLYNVRESYRKSRDLSVIGIVGWYAFNIIDAAVDAHLKEFDVSDKLTIKFEPTYQVVNGNFVTGMNLKFQF